MAGKGCLRGNIPSAKCNKDQDMPPTIQGCVPGGSINKDAHYERAGEVGAKKYLRKSCCHCIEYSATNFLATFM